MIACLYTFPPALPCQYTLVICVIVRLLGSGHPARPPCGRHLLELPAFTQSEEKALLRRNDGQGHNCIASKDRKADKTHMLHEQISWQKS